MNSALRIKDDGIGGGGFLSSSSSSLEYATGSKHQATPDRRQMKMLYRALAMTVCLMVAFQFTDSIRGRCWVKCGQ